MFNTIISVAFYMETQEVTNVQLSSFVSSFRTLLGQLVCETKQFKVNLKKKKLYYNTPFY